jgi:solute:Na+ symporter, SSS family
VAAPCVAGAHGVPGQERRREGQLLGIGRVFSGLFMVVAALWAPVLAGFPTIVLIALLGFVGYISAEIFGLYELQFLYAAGIMLALSVVVFTVSLLTEAPQPEEIEEYVWTRTHWRSETEELRGAPAWKNYRYLTLGAVAITLAMIAPFIRG